jgi:hypothetical protein
MSVNYIQRTSHQYTEEKLSDKAFSKVAAKLMDSGLVLCSSYHWRSSTPEVQYGLVDEETTKTVYHVSINDKFALTATYASDAKLWKSSLIANGFDCDYTIEETQTTKQIWAKPKGTSLFIVSDAHDWDGEPKLMQLNYAEGVKLTPTLRNAADGVFLEFETTWELEKVARKADIESTMVETPLHDLGLITSIVESALGEREPVMVDCKFHAETQTTSECAPDIIAMRRQAAIDARNGTQEEE